MPGAPEKAPDARISLLVEGESGVWSSEGKFWQGGEASALGFGVPGLRLGP